MIVPTVDRGFCPPRLLRNRDRRVEPRDQIDVGLGHLAEKLPGETRQALDVAPLSLGIQGVEGQRAFARPADAREADQPVSGQRQIDIAEVVLSGAANEDVGSGHENVIAETPRDCAGGVGVAAGGLFGTNPAL